MESAIRLHEQAEAFHRALARGERQGEVAALQAGGRRLEGGSVPSLDRPGESPADAHALREGAGCGLVARFVTHVRNAEFSERRLEHAARTGHAVGVDGVGADHAVHERELAVTRMLRAGVRGEAERGENDESAKQVVHGLKVLAVRGSKALACMSM